MPSSHERPLDGSEVAARIAAAAPQRAVAVMGQYSPAPSQVERMLVYAERDRRLVAIVDDWVTVETRDGVLQSLHPIVATGGCTAMYATKAKYVWAMRDGELRLWRHGRLAARFARDRIETYGLFGAPLPWPASDRTRVRAWIAGDWVARGVRLEDGQRSIVVARMREIGAWLDPTYDGIDLLCDAAWVTDLARAIADAAGIDVAIDDALQ